MCNYLHYLFFNYVIAFLLNFCKYVQTSYFRIRQLSKIVLNTAIILIFIGLYTKPSGKSVTQYNIYNIKSFFLYT